MRRAVIAAALLLAACQKDQPPTPAAVAVEPKKAAEPGTLELGETERKLANLRLAPPQREDEPAVLSAPGTLERNEDATYQASALTTGRVLRVPVKLGDAVRAGQVLATYLSHDTHEARAEYEKARSVQAEAVKRRELAVRMRDRARRLLDLRAGSQSELDAAESEVRRLEGEVERAATEVARTRRHLVEYLGIPLEQSAVHSENEDHDALYIRSSAAGTVIERKVNTGSMVGPGEPAFTISNLSSLWLMANVNEADIGAVRSGQTVRVQVKAYPDREFRGTVLRLGESMDAATRTMQVRIAVPNPQGLLKPEMFATVQFERRDQRSTALWVPEAAVQEINGVSAVFLAQGEHFRMQPVSVGRRRAGQAEVTAGLQGAEQVVVQGAFVLKSQLLKGSLAEE